jgi:heme/copper-type cytochrome/quinol oxidase subunit 2
MPGTRQAKVRVAALAALVLLAGMALRGQLPGAQRANRAEPTNNTASLLALIALVTACLLVIIVSIVVSLRDPQRARQAARYDVPGGGGVGGAQRSWRFLLIIVAAILAWLLVVALFAQLRLPQLRGGPASSQPGTAAPGGAPPGHGTVPQPPPPAPGAGEHAFWYLVVSMTALLVVILVGGVLLRIRGRRRLAPAPPEDGQPAHAEVTPGPGSLVLAAERGLAEVGDLSREPREAIIACYAAMEHALANAPGAAPQESDTPSEVLARAVEHEAIHAGSATELVTLFAEARFSTHVMNEGHREAAERVLRLVLAELRSPV